MPLPRWMAGRPRSPPQEVPAPTSWRPLCRHARNLHFPVINDRIETLGAKRLHGRHQADGRLRLNCGAIAGGCPPGCGNRIPRRGAASRFFSGAAGRGLSSPGSRGVREAKKSGQTGHYAKASKAHERWQTLPSHASQSIKKFAEYILTSEAVDLVWVRIDSLPCAPINTAGIGA